MEFRLDQNLSSCPLGLSYMRRHRIDWWAKSLTVPERGLSPSWAWTKDHIQPYIWVPHYVQLHPHHSIISSIPLFWCQQCHLHLHNQSLVSVPAQESAMVSDQESTDVAWAPDYQTVTTTTQKHKTPATEGVLESQSPLSNEMPAAEMVLLDS